MKRPLSWSSVSAQSMHILIKKMMHRKTYVLHKFQVSKKHMEVVAGEDQVGLRF